METRAGLNGALDNTHLLNSAMVNMNVLTVVRYCFCSKDLHAGHAYMNT